MICEDFFLKIQKNSQHNSFKYVPEMLLLERFDYCLRFGSGYCPGFGNGVKTEDL